MELLKRDCVRELLIVNNLTSMWLIDQLKDYFNIEVSKAELSRMLGGKRVGQPKTEKVLDASLSILNDYTEYEKGKAERLAK